MAKPQFMKCMQCGHQQEFQPLAPTICEKCNSAWVEAHYDYARFKRELLRGLPVFRGMHRFLPTLIRGNGGGRQAEIPVGHRPRRSGQPRSRIPEPFPLSRSATGRR